MARMLALWGTFSDAVPHTKRDSFFAFYWSNILDGERILICALRKKDLCRCGCRGFCTLGQVMRVISWSFNCLATGKFPGQRHDQTPFEHGSARQELAGKSLAGGLVGALVEMRADLLEIVGACGFKQWSNVDHPCFLCESSRAQLYEFPINMRAHQWVLRDASSYNHSVQQALMKREITTPAMLRTLADLLWFGPRSGGMPGLSLREAFPEIDLPAGTRLIETGPLQDIHRVSEVDLPATLTFLIRRVTMV